MKKDTFIFGILVLVLITLGNQTLGQQKKAARNYDRYCSLQYSDGSPVSINSLSSVEDMEIKDMNHSYNQGWITSLRKDSIKIHCNWAGKYIILFAGKKIGQFEVTEKKGKLVSDLPATIVLPFYYLIKAPPHSQILTYSSQGTLTHKFQIDTSGLLYLTKKPDRTSETFIACSFPDHFPVIQPLNDLSDKNNALLRHHIIQFSPPQKAPEVVTGSYNTTQYNASVVHNLEEDAYYKIIKTVLVGTRETFLWLTVYDAKDHKSSISMIPMQGNRKNAAYSLFLNENGRPVVVVSQQDPKTYEYTHHFFRVQTGGSLEAFENKIFPRYAFKGNYFEGSQWIIPTDFGIVLKPGSHAYKVSCTGSWTAPNPEAEKWSKKLREINKRLYHSKGKLAEGEYARLLKEKSALESAGRPKGKPDIHGKKTSTSTVKVEFSPEEKYLYKIDRKDENYQDFNNMNIEKCFLSIDGSGPLSYSYEEVLNSFQAVPNVKVGTDPDVKTSDVSFPLFQKNINAGWPVNLWEGPYPQLRYKVKQITGKYNTYKEAIKHSDKVQKYYDEFITYQEKIIQVCPENYRYSVVDGRVITDTAALYCGKSEVPKPESHQIVISVYAKGYRAKTVSLDKTNLELSDIHLNGKIIDEQGNPVKNAKVLMVGFDKSLITGTDGTYKLEAKAQGKHPLFKTMNIQLEALKFEVSNKTLGTYQPYQNFGLVSDGFTTLKLHVKTDGINLASVVVHPPALGDFVPQSSLKIPLVLNEKGEGDMEYVPPAYLKNSYLNKLLKISEEDKGKKGLSGNLWAADVPVSISYEDKDGNPGTYIFHILVCRPPVMLIHGFTGDESTWQYLAVQLRRDKYDAIIREYYKGPIEESTIERQSQKLGAYIQELREAYLKNGILQNRVDIVAHSMGGLISRYYISNMAKYGKTAGIYIPYNVKLSPETLAQQRFQKPFVLNDVRKLIMVGTPNHGSSFMDERIGAWNALISKVHQLANGELRYDSPFLAKLNAGESEGRHLDRHVQYALIYGKRRRSQVYPLDNVLHPVATALRELTDDDGVVTVKSAMLNGVASYGFPENQDKYAYGYIHSPAIANFCTGDASITVDTLIFNKIERLLQEDIPRIPLKHSETRIISANGDVSMRYMATQNWIHVRVPINYLHPKKLAYNFCQLKTGTGSATLGFFLNGHHWGNLNIQPNTIVYYDFASPESVRFYLRQGKARFRSKKQNGGGFEVVTGDKTGEKWYTFNPRARVKDLNTDFIVEQDSVLNVHSISGKVMITALQATDKKQSSDTISTKRGVVLLENNEMKESPLPDSGWWSHTDTTFLPDNIYDTSRFLLPANTVLLTFSDPYLPVSGFSTLKVHTGLLPGDSVMSKYRVKISLKNDSLLPFITVTNPVGVTDSTGNFKTEITFRTPAPGNYTTLKKLPLSASFNVVLFKHNSDTVVFEKSITLPLGMTLLTGQTTGPGYQPRKEPPPQLNQIIYQIATESDSLGHYSILFNTTSYNKNREQFQKLASSVDSSGENRWDHFSLQWPASGMFPVTYQLDSLKKHLLPGQKIILGKKGIIDICSPPEQENRLKEFVRQFIVHMALTREDRNRILKKLETLNFQYQAKVSSPVWIYEKNLIAIPTSAEEFWNLNTENSSTAYSILIQIAGRFLVQNVNNHQERHFAFLQAKDAQKDSETPANAELFSRKDYKTFYQTETEFFNFLLNSYLKKAGNVFTSKSVYYQNIDTTEFNNQSKFLIALYGDLCEEKPAAVFSDFLFTRMIYSGLTGNSHPAATMQEWLATKKVSYQRQFIVKTDNPLPRAAKFGLLPEKWDVLLIPKADFAHCSIQVGGKTITGFGQIPALPLRDTSTVKILSGNFLLQFLPSGPASVIEAVPGAVFKLDTNNKLVHLSGKLLFRASVPFQTQQASFIPGSNNFMVSVDPKHTVLNVYDGEVEVKNEKADQTVHAGETTTIGKRGSIKKPKPMKEFTVPEPVPKVKYPFTYTSLQK